MCGITAVRGSDAGRLALAGLRHLEYRGYDSAGLAVVGDGGHLRVERAAGPLDVLVTQIGEEPQLLDPAGRLAIGHTRWATHGEVSARNAHPLVDCYEHVAVVHNGVLDNAEELRDELRLTGHRIRTEVDSELIAHLVERELGSGADPFVALRKTVARLHGSWAIAMLVDGFDALYLARQRSPLLVRGTPERLVAASDPIATLGVPGPLRALDDGDVVELGRRWRWAGGDGVAQLPPVLDESRRPAPDVDHDRSDATAAEGQGGPVTAAEIAEQAPLVERLVDEILTHLSTASGWRHVEVPVPNRVLLLGCGTSYHAAQLTARVLRSIAGVPAEARIASEWERCLSDPVDLVIAISQSGETADLLGALDRIDGPVLAITNNIWSSLARRADAVLDCRAGYERGVAATKSFTAQVLVGVGFALAVAHAVDRGDLARAAARSLSHVPGEFAAAEALGSPIGDRLIRRLSAAPGWLFLGTGSGLPYAAEGALKLKEISYRWAQSYPAAELKHGPLALVERGTPVVVIDNGAPRLMNALAEVSARGAYVIKIGGRDVTAPVELPEGAPWGPLHVVPALQHLAVAIGAALGRDVDRPRNLAKSVTVG